MAENKNVAIILSGGSGNRFKHNIPKQFAEVSGKTILGYCIKNFNAHKNIDKILIVSNPDYIDLTHKIVESDRFIKVIDIINGGKTRGESSYSGLKYLKAKYNSTDVNVLIQDAVRPNTNENIINNVIEKLKESRAVSVVVPATDTIYITDKNYRLVSIPDRDSLFLAQTPQAFNLELILSAYEKTDKSKRFSFTDDCSVLKQIYPNEKINLVTGDVTNLKITFNKDLETFRQLLQDKTN